jgi:hypothetical protein
LATTLNTDAIALFVTLATSLFVNCHPHCVAIALVAVTIALFVAVAFAAVAITIALAALAITLSVKHGTMGINLERYLSTYFRDSKIYNEKFIKL